MMLPRSKPHGHEKQHGQEPRRVAGRQESHENLAGQRVSDLAERLSRTLAIACALAESGRQVDLTGIEDGVGMLCAQTLDLPLGHSNAMVPMLRDLLSRVDRLTLLLEQSGTG